MSERLSITKYGQRYWAVWLDGELLAVTLYKKGARGHHGRDYDAFHTSREGGPSWHPSRVNVRSNQPRPYPCSRQ
jgi:hypothetical protein